MDELTAKELASLIDVSVARVGQLAKEKVIVKKDNGKYEPSAVGDYIRFIKNNAEKKERSWSLLLEQEKYREKKRQNDLEEKRLAPVQVLENVLSRGIAGMIPILEGLPLTMKRNFPELSGDQITIIKRAVAECRNCLADVEFKND